MPRRQRPGTENNNEGDDDDDDVASLSSQVTAVTEAAGTLLDEHGNPADTRGRPAYNKTWVFTLWELEKPEMCRAGTFLCAQQEQSPNPAEDNRTGGKHWQGYMEFGDRVGVAQIRRMMRWTDKAVYLAKRLGSQQQAIEYTKKADTAVPDTWFQQGTPAPPDAFHIMDRLKEKMEEGASFKDLATDGSTFRACIQYATGVTKVLAAHQETPEHRPVKVVYLWGDAGTGKTYGALKRHAHKDIYFKISGQWWDGYEGQDVIVLDEFYGRDMPIDIFLRVLDVHPLEVNVRGGTRVARWTTVYITANKPWESLYRGFPDNYAALDRRCPSANRYHFRRGAPRPDLDQPSTDVAERDLSLPDTDQSHDHSPIKLPPVAQLLEFPAYGGLSIHQAQFLAQLAPLLSSFGQAAAQTPVTIAMTEERKREIMKEKKKAELLKMMEKSGLTVADFV